MDVALEPADQILLVGQLRFDGVAYADHARQLTVVDDG
jgi:hypothetical protein